MTDSVEIVEVVPEAPVAGARWDPRPGPEATALLDSLALQDDGRATVQREALAILARCTPPAAPTADDTGLVVGYVQSGKTMSFTTVTALARDNHYRMVIVIAGISDPLLNQSID